MTFRIQHAQRDGTKVIDVDGSYLHQKEQRLNATGITTLPLNLPSIPLCGWEQLTKENHKEIADKIPRVSSGMCMYLSELILYEVYKDNLNNMSTLLL